MSAIAVNKNGRASTVLWSISKLKAASVNSRHAIPGLTVARSSVVNMAHTRQSQFKNNYFAEM